LKITPILVQFLLNNKHLSLPGIGRLTITKEGSSKNNSTNEGNETSTLPPLKFVSNPLETAEDNLISFIAKESGKMKSLAAADFSSYLGLAKEILYSGKPFLMEGIGLFSKNKNNQFDFTPENIIAEKNKEVVAELTTATEESFSNYNSVLLKGKKTEGGRKKALATFIILSGIALAIWGGYFIYKKDVDKQNAVSSSEIKITNQDSVRNTHTVNSLNTASKSENSVQTYRFIIERASLSRALTRYNQLKGYGLSVKMGTSDSSVYKVFFELPAKPADTLRIADSLSFLYKLKGEKKVWAE